MIAVSWLFRRATPRRVDRWFRRLQFVSAAAYSLGHGGNDAQKTMGIIWMLLIAAGYAAQADPLPFWVVIACQAAMGLGTLFGGWRIVKTMGMRITKLRPQGGFCASASGAATLFLATGLGIPVSTTHTITGVDRRRRLGAEALRSALGRRGQHRVGVDLHHSVLGVHRRHRVVVRRPLPVSAAGGVTSERGTERA